MNYWDEGRSVRPLSMRWNKRWITGVRDAEELLAAHAGDDFFGDVRRHLLVGIELH